MFTLVGNIDSDPRLEILATGLARGPLHAWHYNGTRVTGWPRTPSSAAGAAFPSLGKLGQLPWKVFAAFVGCADPECSKGVLIGYDGSGIKLPGWPKQTANYVGSPASLEHVAGTDLDEIFVEEEDWKLHGYDALGVPLPGWPIWGSGGQVRHTPAIGDLDGDGDFEIVTASGWTTGGFTLFAYHHTGAKVAGFPIRITANNGDTWPVIGDVDRDGKNEVVVIVQLRDERIRIYSGSGVLERTIVLTGNIDWGTAPALADLNGDGILEIIVQGGGWLDAYSGNGQHVPGWPVVWSKTHWLGNSAPVVGDVDGDLKPDIVVTTLEGGQSEIGELRAYSAAGKLLPHFPKVLPIGFGGVPAIADIDLDGRNEIVICGDYWSGVENNFAKCWAYDLHKAATGKPLWGQFGGDAAHSGRYPVPR
ncbi:MAG TPA: VCBS repeat-containing protein [bacterium]